MQLTINEQVHENLKAHTLADLVQELSLQTPGIAIAINQQVIARESWKSCTLQEGDTICIIRATHGG